MPLPLFTCRPIGIIHTPHINPAQTPRQPIHAAGFTGRVEIFPEFAAGLEGLERFARIWLIFAFHKAETPRLHVIPHGQTQERGVFTTRAPCRPGGIGMSLVPLLRRDGNILHVSHVDMLNGPPCWTSNPTLPIWTAAPYCKAAFRDTDESLGLLLSSLYAGHNFWGAMSG